MRGKRCATARPVPKACGDGRYLRGGRGGVNPAAIDHGGAEQKRLAALGTGGGALSKGRQGRGQPRSHRSWGCRRKKTRGLRKVEVEEGLSGCCGRGEL